MSGVIKTTSQASVARRVLLGEYESNRDRYGALDAFMPKVVAFFNEYAEKFEQVVAEAPKVVSMVPANGAQDVDPNLTEIKVTFDRPMKDGHWAVVGGGPNFPERTDAISFDKDRKVLTIQVRLKPDWSYRFWLNRGQYMAFMSEDGALLEPVEVTFKTASNK